MSKFPKGFDFGRSSRSEFNPILGKTIYEFSHDVEVIFGNKGENLICKNILNGKVVGTAEIRFDRH